MNDKKLIRFEEKYIRPTAERLQVVDKLNKLADKYNTGFINREYFFDEAIKLMKEYKDGKEINE